MSLGQVDQGYRRRFYVLGVKEATYDGGAASMTHVFDTLPGGALSRVNVATETDAALCNGVEFPQKQRYLEQTSSAQFRSYASPEAMGLWGAFALGDDAVGQVGSSGAYLHTITQTAAGVFPGSTMIQDNRDGPTVDTTVDFRLTGMAVSSFSFLWSESGFSTLEVDLVGSGRSATASTQTESELSKATLYFSCSRVGCWIRECAVQGTPIWAGTWAASTSAGNFNTYTNYDAVGQHISSGKFTWTNPYAAQYRAGTTIASGLYGVQPQILKRSASVELTWLRDAVTEDYVQALMSGSDAANKEYSLVIEAISDQEAGTDGSVYSAAIILPLAAIEQVPSGDTSDLATDTITFSAKKAYTGSPLRDPVHMFVCDKRTTAYNQ